MPEYLAPGVYVEETSFRPKSIEGVGTSTTAFVGPTRRGPTDGLPELVTSLPDFERLYGGLENLSFSSGASTLNYVAHAARAYFDNGGRRLYVMRTIGANATAATGLLRNGDGTASDQAHFVARFQGEAGNGRVMVRVSERPVARRQTLDLAPPDSLLWLRFSDTSDNTLYAKGADGVWRQADASALPQTTFDAAGSLVTEDDGLQGADLLTLAVTAQDANGFSQSWEGLGFGPAHSQAIHTVLAEHPERRSAALTHLVWARIGATVTAFELHQSVVALTPNADGDRLIALSGGADGNEPVAGAETQAGSYAAALAQLTNLEDISIVAAPGSSAFSDAQAITNALIGHVERRRAYRIAVVDAAPDRLPSEIRQDRGRIDSRFAAFYYPWVVVSNPLAVPGREDIPSEIALPPSGFVCGIYARNDTLRGVHKAPANEVVTGALRFSYDVNFAEQEMLNPLGINCLRYLSGRGYRVWGARLASSDPEWKYVSDRRYFNYLEASIDRSTQWAVFEPNGHALWNNIKQTVSDFFYNEWRNDALLGAKPEEAYFVRCDRSTMTQNDLDNGRLVCLIGVALLRPAEFVIFRIGQKTADARG
jgi:phage tail sheath protein FI